MTFAVKKQHRMAKNLKKILLSQTDRAIKQLEDFEQSPIKAVHEARISFKRVRTVLRLLRKVLGKETSQYYNSIYRDLGRILSEQRDAFIKKKTLEKYHSKKNKTARKSTLSVPLIVASTDDEHAVHEVLNSLYALRIELAGETFDKKGFSVLRKAAEEFYERIQRSQKSAEKTNHDDEYHEWRKDVKHLYHLVSFMIPVRPSEYKPQKKELHELIELLGDDHDLTVLREDISKNKPDKTALLKKLSKEQVELRIKAKKLGTKLVTEDAFQFVERMESNWRKFRSS